MLVVSPHLDDAVLGVGDVLAVATGATVVTAFTASPDRYPDPPTAWSRVCGFGPADDIAAVRRAEDERALARLGARAVHLAFVELAHAVRPPDPGAVPDGFDEALAATIRAVGPTAVLVPLALGHPEHRLVAEAVERIRSGFRDPVWIAYAEIPYLAVPGALAVRLAELTATGVVLEPLVPGTDPMARARKVAALEAYTSQVGPLDDWWSIRRRVRETPESLWRIVT